MGEIKGNVVVNMEDNHAIAIEGFLFGVGITVVAVLFFLSLINTDTGSLDDIYTGIESDLVNESVYNFGVMRDLFTPMYNDTVVIEWIGYKSAVYDWGNNTKLSEGGYVFWVNHSRVLDSFYFEDAKCYKVLFPTWGHIEILQLDG